MSKDENDIKIYKYLDGENLKHSNLGYRYLLDAIKLIIDKPLESRNMGEIYQVIAEMHNTSSNCVERAIRHAILKKKKSNKEFIRKASDEIRYID